MYSSQELLDEHKMSSLDLSIPRAQSGKHSSAAPTTLEGMELLMMLLVGHQKWTMLLLVNVDSLGSIGAES